MNARPLFYAVVRIDSDGAQLLRTFTRKVNARKWAKRYGATLCAKYAGHAGLSILERPV